MKFTITFKDPDGVYESLQEEARSTLTNQALGLTEKEYEALLEAREDTMKEFISPWIQYGEYVTIEFDTEQNTATVVKKK